MILKDALARACKAIIADKQQQVLRHILLVPRSDAHPAHVVAGDGKVWTQLTLDDGVEVVSGVIAAEKIAPLLVDAQDIEEVVYADGGGALTFAVRTKAQTLAHTEIQVLPPSQYPTTQYIDPAAYDWMPLEGYKALPRLCRAVGDDPARAHLMAVHVGPRGAGATDGQRIHLAEIKLPWEGLIPAALFERIPTRKLDVRVASDTQRARLRFEDEIRMAKIAPVTPRYPDIWNRVPTEPPYTGPRFIVATKSLTNAVTQASKVKGAGAIRLKIRKESLYVESATEDATQHFKTCLQGLEGNIDADLLLRGSWVVDALRDIKTPQVLVGYHGPLDPLRIESGRNLAFVWPLLQA